jgi:hypothetical protein
VWAGVDNVWEQKKLENAADRARKQSAATIAHPGAWTLGIPQRPAARLIERNCTQRARLRSSCEWLNAIRSHTSNLLGIDQLFGLP